jgi:hypothetical protein
VSGSEHCLNNKTLYSALSGLVVTRIVTVVQ